MESGDYYYNKAQKYLNKFNWWGYFSYEDIIIENYINAGEKYKLSKSYENAGDSYYRVASLYYNNTEYYYAAGFYIQAAEMYKHVDNMLTESLINIAIKIYSDLNRFDYAGKYTEMLIDVRNDLNLNYKLSLYYKVYHYYTLANLKYEMNECLKKINLINI